MIGARAGLVGCGTDELRLTIRRRQVLVDVGALLDELGDDDRDVVVATRLERQPDQLGRGEVDRLGAEGHLDDVVVDHVGQAVAAQQVAVAQHRLQPVVVGVVVVTAEQRTQQERAVRVHAGLVAADLALVDQALHERVVGADLLERPVTEAVGARVAEVRVRDLRPVPEHRLERGAHPLDGGVAGDQLAEPGVGGGDGLLERGHRVDVQVTIELTDDVQRLGGGDVSGSGTAHAVGHHQEPVAGVAGVLVGGPAQTGVGQCDIAKGE